MTSKLLPVPPRPPRAPAREIEDGPPENPRKGMLGRIMLLLSFALLLAFGATWLAGGWLVNFFAATGEIVPLRILLSMNSKWANARIASEPGAALSETPMLSAFVNDHVEAARLLFERGADPNLSAEVSYKAMNAAAKLERVELLEAYAKAGGLPNSRSLRYAMTRNDGAALLRLIAPPGIAKGDPFVAGELSRALEHLPPPWVVWTHAYADALLLAGAEADSPSGAEACGAALWFGDRATATLLLSKGARPLEKPCTTSAGAEKWLRAVLAGGVDLEERSPKSGFTPLLNASANLDEAFAVAMVQAGADPQAAVSGGAMHQFNGRKPLHFAVERRLPVLAAALLGAGADPLARDGARETPLDLAFDPKLKAMLEAAIAAYSSSPSPSPSPTSAPLPLPAP